MFLGQFNHTLDYKGRTSIPKKFRDDLQDGSILTRGFEGCLFLYPLSEWEILSNRIAGLPLTASDARNFSRYLFSSAIATNFDRLGRITIPDYLAKAANLKKDLVIIGVLNRVEIWSKELWDEFNKRMEKDGGDIAEKLSGSGV